jgi:hypothetical protein
MALLGLLDGVRFYFLGLWEVLGAPSAPAPCIACCIGRGAPRAGASRNVALVLASYSYLLVLHSCHSFSREVVYRV